MSSHKSLSILFAAVCLNYLAQIPYYLYLYYFPHHVSPSVPGIVLLGTTLGWFVAGYALYRRGKRYGRMILLAFLIVQVLFYAHSFLLGALVGGGVVGQLKTHSPLLLVVFLIGYLNFFVAAYYTWWLIKHGGGVSGAKQNQ